MAKNQSNTKSLYGDMEIDCVENENSIGFKMSEEDPSIIDEMYIGCKFTPCDGVSVLGMRDLTRAFKKIGYLLVKKE